MARCGCWRGVRGHPAGLAVLFFTELWERFSYYGMRAILVLYMVAPLEGANPGLGWSEADALSLYGWYTMAVYLAAVPGGLLADRCGGAKRCVMLGGALLCAGHGLLALPSRAAFFSGLALITAGCGALKPNVSTLVGRLYALHDPRRDMGFTIFYIGINVGAFAASLVVGYVGEAVGWHYGFGLAGIGMCAGQAVFVVGRGKLDPPLLPHEAPPPLMQSLRDDEFQEMSDVESSSVGSASGGCQRRVPADQQRGDGRRTAAASPCKFTAEEKDRLKVCAVCFALIICFWGAFEQAGGLMNLYTQQRVDRRLGGFEIPASAFQALNPFFIMVLGAPVAARWQRRKASGREASSLFKMAVGMVVMGVGFLAMCAAAVQAGEGWTAAPPDAAPPAPNATAATAAAPKASMLWLVAAYLLHTLGELSASPVALSYVTKLAPARHASTVLGLYFAASGVGNKVAGVLGEVATRTGALSVFAGIFLFCAAVGLAVCALLGRLNRLAHGVEDADDKDGAEPLTEAT